MSDCFDHGEYLEDWDFGFDSPLHFSKINRDAYHCWFTIGQLIRETEKAFLYQHDDLQIWIAKKLIRKVESERIFVHRDTFIKIVENTREALNVKRRRFCACPQERIEETGGSKS